MSVWPSPVGVLGVACPSDSDCGIVKPQFPSFSRKRQSFVVESQEDTNYDGTPVKAPPAPRRKIMPPTPQKSPQPSIEVTQLQMEVEDQEFAACGKE